MKFEKFEDIDSWKEARILTQEIYQLSKDTRLANDFGLRDQIQRASVSIMSNIAEGFDSGTTKSFINFLNYSYRSVSEVQSLLYVIKDQQYINDSQFNEFFARTVKIKKLLGGFIKYLKSTKNYEPRTKNQ